MTDQTNATRRAFLKGGAVLAAPLAVAVPGAALAADDQAERLRRLEDEAAIRALHRAWMRQVNARGETAALFSDARAARCLDDAVCGIAADADETGGIEIVADGRRAKGSFVCVVEIESRLAPQNTFARMALAQGGGVTRTSERRLVEADYVKIGENWAIAGIETRVV